MSEKGNEDKKVYYKQGMYRGKENCLKYANVWQKGSCIK